MKFVNMSAGKVETSVPKLYSGPNNRAEQPPMNPPRVKRDPFAPRVKEQKEPRIIKSPVSSSIRGDPKKDKPVTNEDIMALLLKALNK